MVPPTTQSQRITQIDIVWGYPTVHSMFKTNVAKINLKLRQVPTRRQWTLLDCVADSDRFQRDNNVIMPQCHEIDSL